jgi:hypothetical protein
MWILAGLVVLGMTGVGHSAADTNMEILLQKVKADKKLLVANNMGLTEEEGKHFWPLYDEYQKELDRINHHLGSTIKEYADAYNKGPLSDAEAKKLMDQAISVEEEEAKLKRTYAEKIGKVLPAAKTARYIKIRSLLKAELAQDIPLIH